MHRTPRVLLSLTVAFSSLVSGCSSGPNSVPDSGVQGDAGPQCSAASSYSSAFAGPTAHAETAMSSIQATASQGMTVLDILLADGLGAFSGGTVQPGTYVLAGDELQFATCGVCVRLLVDDRDWYMATGGTVTIMSVSPRLTLSLTDVTFEHVTIDVMSAVSTPVGDGCTSAVQATDLDAVVM